MRLRSGFLGGRPSASAGCAGPGQVVRAAGRSPAVASIDRYDRVGNVASDVAQGRLYAGELDIKDPLVSPLYADLTGRRSRIAPFGH
jgi:hypothetical protein